MKQSIDLRRMTHADLAQLCGVTRQAVTAWVTDGMPTQGRAGIDLEKALPWIIKSRYTPPGSERERLARAQAEKHELDNAQSRGELIRLDQHADILMALTTATTSSLESIPGRLAGELATMTEPALIRARIQDEIRGARTAIAAALDKLAERQVIDPDSGADDEAAETQDGERVGERESDIAPRKRGARTVSKRADAVHHSD